MKKLVYGIAIIITILVINTLSGNNRMEEIVVVKAIGIDSTESGYKVSVQVINPAAANPKTASGDVAAYVITQSDPSIPTAIHRMNQKAAHHLFTEDIDLILISEKAARKKGIEEIINYILRDPMITADVKVIIVKNQSAESVLRIFTTIKKIPSIKLASILDNVEKNSYISQIRPNLIKSRLLFSVKQVNIPAIQVVGKTEEGFKKENVETMKPASYLTVAGYAYFQGDKLAGFLNEKESLVYTLIQNEIKKAVIEAPCPQNKKKTVSMAVFSAKAKPEITFHNGKPVVSFITKIKGNITNEVCNINLSKPESIEKIRKAFAEAIEKDFEKLIQKSQQEKVDFLGIGRKVYLVHPREWNQIKSRWNEIFPEMDINVKVNIQINDAGDVMNIPN